MLEFLLFILAGAGYALCFDLNPLEIALAAVVLFAASRGWKPKLPAGLWRGWIGIARRRKTAVAAVFFGALIARAALLPVLPAPDPAIPDEFSHLLLADTLAHGRLTNPTHPMWEHFESIHIIQRPTYNSDYFPGQAAALAPGVAAGHPWVAVWILSAIMCAALCWMLQAWVGPVWALFGGLLAILRFGIASYWVNSYYGGCLAAIGGALVLGAWPRLLRRPTLMRSLLFGLGVTIIGYTRPFEGLAVALPAAAVMAVAILKRQAPFRVCIPATAVVMAGIGGLLVYCKAVTGDPFKTPYAVNQATYGWPMTLAWYDPPHVQLRNVELQRYYQYEREVHERNASLGGELENSTLKAQWIWRFYFGPALSIPFIMLPAVWRSGRLRLLLAASGLTLALAVVETGVMPHYTAAATACFLAVVVECFRRVRKRRFGPSLVIAAPAILALIIGVRIGLEKLGLPFTQGANYQSWCCVHPGSPNKARILAELEKSGGRHLVLVEPKQDPDNLFQWIYNAADIDASPVVWARELGPAGNRALLEYFRGRKIWRLDPNVSPPRLTPLASVDLAAEANGR